MAITIDESFKKIGEFRQYQWYILTLMGYCILTVAAFNGMIVAFIAAEPDWKCVEGYKNNTVCRFNNSITLTSDDYKARCKMPREAWTFVDDFTSIVTEYDLVCGDSILLSFAQSSWWFGMLVGLLFAGSLSDKYGRRKIISAGFIISTTAAIVVVFPKNFVVFIVCRLIFGLGSGFINSSAFSLLTEFTTDKYHSWLGIGYFTFYALGLMILPLIGFLAPAWRTFLLITALFAAPVLLLVWLIPESPRWLLLNQKEKEARNQLLKVAKMNKRTLPDDEFVKPVISKPQASLKLLFSTRKVAKITLISWNLWFTHALVLYGVSYGSVDLGGNRYLNFFLLSLVAAPANFFCMWAVNRFGRKVCIIFGLIITFLASAVLVSIPANKNPANIGGRVTAAIIARFFIGFSFNGCYVWTSELYPTVIRATAMSTSSGSARVGSFAASYIIWLIRIHVALPYSIFGAICIQAAILGLFLPETKGAATKETMDDMRAHPENGMDLHVYTNNAIDQS
ncbi:solute carrier family 22 member 15-like [Dendronephthya gigantea]|uniref:solute carrier family 22 member 15-like n=1 Tax=Dendronephthya gigantea TaxID=151771 RepID=UPI00106A3CEB|nr:solute carrier family 22 member 15-like [Dendronephthya gigantea]XP_028401287.1 solute carrier family 22 member 15-like [Dendronephthya gigantea]